MRSILTQLLSLPSSAEQCMVPVWDTLELLEQACPTGGAYKNAMPTVLATMSTLSTHNVDFASSKSSPCTMPLHVCRMCTCVTHEWLASWS
jgi:hypothetical protein